ncbi:hypothetical protein Taro_048236 [Colocasia esculenta]|uniref:BHLH domain-containing protein n=1 Tax=Colocasia esculenta TaxID=4460 RepID=A0A843X7R3_COLES|nr:hypothetical protein [Colocasia esculenta]
MSGVASHPPLEGAGDDFFEQLLSMPLYGGGIAGAGEGNPGDMLPDQGSGLSGQVAASSSFRGGVEDGGHPKPEDRGPGGSDPFLEAAAAMTASFATALRTWRDIDFHGEMCAANDKLPRRNDVDGTRPYQFFVPPLAGLIAQEVSEDLMAMEPGEPVPARSPLWTPVCLVVLVLPVIFDGQDVVPQPQASGPRVRAKRGQATNPHSIAERLRRERIAERMRALQELVPKCNKTDRAAMLDEIVDYVKFLRLQVKVLSMSRHGGTGASSQLAADSPQPQLEGDMSEDGSNSNVWERWSVGGSTEQQVAKLMEEDIGAAMQFLQSNALCIMPISLAASICRMHNQPGSPSTVKTDPGASS